MPTAKKPLPKKEGAPKRAAAPLPIVRGMRDVLNPDWPYHDKLFDAAKRTAEDYGYERIETPVLEETALFVRGVGKITDIVEKEMYSFETAGRG